MTKTHARWEEVRPVGIGVNYADVLNEEQAAAAHEAVEAEHRYFALVREAQGEEQR